MSRISVVPAAVLALALPTASLAATPPPQPPPDTPSISQYVEQVPTSRGGWSAVGGKTQTRALLTQVTTRLHSNRDAVSQQLEKVATSSTYGAPQHMLPKPAKDSREPKTEPKASNALSAAVSAVNDSGDSHLISLLLAVVLVTIAMVWASAGLRVR